MMSVSYNTAKIETLRNNSMHYKLIWKFSFHILLAKYFFLTSFCAKKDCVL